MPKHTDALTTIDQEQRAREIYNFLNQSNDSFEQRIKVLKFKKIDGKIKTDKDGNPMIDDFGEIQKWEDIYTLTYIAMNSGGEHTTRITQAQFMELQENEIYIASGKIEYRLYKDNYNSTPVIVFDKLIPAIELFVTAMLKFEGLKS